MMIEGKFSTKDMFTNALAEFLGTAMLIILGCVGCLGSLTIQPSQLQITLNFGLAVLIVIQVFIFCFFFTILSIIFAL
jgi:aquaporin related protein